MQLVTTRQARQLTGLSGPTLREWTSRRALIPADVPPRKRGTPAQYGWRTILLLRLAVTMRDRFHLELQAHRSLFANLRRGLRGKSFITLWDKVLALYGGDSWLLIDQSRAELLRQDAVVILLNPHLRALSEGFTVEMPMKVSGQFDLFPALPIGESAPRPAPNVRITQAKIKRLRRSA